MSLKMNRYAKEAFEVESRIKDLRGRVERFSEHPTLHTRVHGVKDDIAELEKMVKVLYSTARWCKELYGN